MYAKIHLRNYIIAAAIFYLLPIIFMCIDINDKVRVYVFYSKNQIIETDKMIDYLKSNEMYNKKFTIHMKEAYIDYNNDIPGEYYKLYQKVVEGMKEKSLGPDIEARLPLVVIGNYYASFKKTEEITHAIKYIHKIGDADLVSCLEFGEKNCFHRHINSRNIIARNISVLVSLTGLTGIVFLYNYKDIKAYKHIMQ